MQIFGISLVLAVAGFARAQVGHAPEAAVAIPDLAALLKEIEANQHKMDEIRENYTFHRIRRVEDLDDKGNVRKTTTLEHEVFFVNGHQIARLVKKDGVTLSPPEEKAEQARVRKLIEVDMKSPKAGHKRTSPVSEILGMVKVSNPRRVSLNGRSTLAFDFTGDPKAKAHDTAQNAAKKVAGTIWFDEADRQVARLEVRLYDNFRIGGGFLASVQKGTTLEVEQSPVGKGLWMQTAVEQHLAARVVVKSLRQNIHVKEVDFKRFDVDVLQQISPPSKRH